MKCPECDGVGRIHYGEEWCSACNGTGEQQTNEEWFCGLSAEEKAEWLYYHSGAMSSKGDWEDWLMEKHQNDRGTSGKGF